MDDQTTGAPLPAGIAPLRDRDRRRVINHKAGDFLEWVEAVGWTDDKGEFVTPDNSILVFRIMDQRFSRDVDTIWEGTWNAGIELAQADTPGVVKITVPSEVTDSFRRGSFIYSLRATGKNGERAQTVFEGHILVDYAPTSPHRNIPYRSDSDQQVSDT